MNKAELLKIAKPILFNTDMVRAILANRKTETRRPVKPQPIKDLQFPYGFITGSTEKKNIGCFCWTVGEICDGRTHNVRPPYKPSDILYVRETWYYESHMQDLTAGEPDLPSGAYSHRYVYKASSPDYPVNVGVGAQGWKPSIHMPKEAARIYLRVTEVRAERLQDITHDDARAEGFLADDTFGERYYFGETWDHVYKGRGYGWYLNPWVWVIKFERLEA